MNIAEVVQGGWEANIELSFARNDDKETLLTRRLHKGPLVVQKPLYPESRAVCHVILLHPPGGVAGGDSLAVNVTTGAGSHALMTTPGAGKWYKSNNRLATQALRFQVQKGSVFEWLPQEAILFDGAEVLWQSHIEIEEDACYMGWEVMCLGRVAAGEKFMLGGIRQETEIFYQGKRIWGEYASIKAGDKILAAAAGLSGKPVTGTFIMVGVEISNELLSVLRAVRLENTSAYINEDASAVTRMGALLIVRYLGHSSETARHYFVAIWRLLRPAVCGRVACNPRIWST